MIEIDLRASSISALFDCPARWEALTLDNKRLPGSGASCLGSAVHHATALYDQSRLDGTGMSVMDASHELLNYIRTPPEDIVWHDITPRQAETVGLGLLNEYCKEMSPEIDYVLVEHTLKAQSIRVHDNLTITMTGTLDRMRQVAGKKGIGDIKTGAQAVDAEGRAKTATHKPQLGAYELLAEMEFEEPMELPASVIGLKTNQNPVIAHDELDGCKEALLNLYLPAAALYFESGVFPGNPMSNLCSNRFCPNYNKCEWRG